MDNSKTKLGPLLAFIILLISLAVNGAFLITYAVIIGTKGNKSCENKTWIMGNVIMYSAAVIIILRCVQIVFSGSNKEDDSTKIINFAISATIFLYMFSVFIATQVYLFKSGNDCKNQWGSMYKCTLAWVIVTYITGVTEIVFAFAIYYFEVSEEPNQGKDNISDQKGGIEVPSQINHSEIPLVEMPIAAMPIAAMPQDLPKELEQKIIEEPPQKDNSEAADQENIPESPINKIVDRPIEQKNVAPVALENEPERRSSCEIPSEASKSGREILEEESPPKVNPSPMKRLFLESISEVHDSVKK